MSSLASRVAPELAASVRAVGTGRRLVELLDADALARWRVDTKPSTRLVELLPALALQCVHEELSEAERASAQLPELLRPPVDGRTHRLHALLLAVRATVPSTTPPRDVHGVLRLEVDVDPPRFRLKEHRGSELPLGASTGFALPEARLTITPSEIRPQCSCGDVGCVHVLEAIDSTLVWLKQPCTDAFAVALDEMLRPAWERALDALEHVLEERPGQSTHLDVSWRLSVDDTGAIDITPWVDRRTKRSQPAQASRHHLLHELAPQLSATDARLAALLPEPGGHASQALLLELVGFTNLTLRDEPSVAVQVERATVGLVAENRQGLVIVTPGVDGTPLPAALVERLRRARANEGLALWEPGGRRLTVLEVTPAVHATHAVLARHGSTFPPESHERLLERLSSLATKVPVALPRSLMGTQVPPQLLMVLRLEAQPDGGVWLQLRLKPLPDSPSVVPGEGARDVHIRRGQTAVHAVRHLGEERAAAEAMHRALPLRRAQPLPTPWAFHFDDAQGALEVLAAARAMTPPPALEWVGSEIRLLSGRVNTGALKVNVEQKRGWFGLLGGLSVHGERVALARLLDAVRRKQRFVSIDAHTFVEVEAALQELLQPVAEQTRQGRHGLELGDSAVPSLVALQRAGVSVDGTAAWRARLARFENAHSAEPAVPRGLKTTLRDYQREGFTWLARLAEWTSGAVLADDMGLGKTVQTLAFLLRRASDGPALVLAPTSVAFNWALEAKRFAPSLRVTVLSDVGNRAEAIERLGPKDVLVVSYGLLTRDLPKLMKRRFTTIVFDEAHTLKNALTERARAARSLKGDFTLALSGTPLENHLGELWAVFAAVLPGLFGPWSAFRERFAAPIELGVDPAAGPALARTLAPFLLRRTKAQVEPQLPPRTDVHVPVVLSAAEWSLYEDARLAALSDLETFKAELKDNEKRIHVLAALS
ncbi:MAG: ATP-dependent helicase, partial [Archangium sp.]|nr:ATP-dependent helicase [Archangium sp.]